MGSQIRRAQPITTKITGPHLAKNGFSDCERNVADVVYQMAPPKKIRSAPKVIWWQDCRFSPDAMLVEAPNMPTISTGQHQRPIRLGKAIRTEDSKTPKPDAVVSADVSAAAGGDGPHFLPLPHSFLSRAFVSHLDSVSQLDSVSHLLSQWSPGPFNQRCAANVPLIIDAATKAPNVM